MGPPEGAVTLLHLGGGLQEDDSLWGYKNSFGGKVFSYSYMTLIADPEQYEHLCSYPGLPWPYLDSRNQRSFAFRGRLALSPSPCSSYAHTQD